MSRVPIENLTGAREPRVGFDYAALDKPEGWEDNFTPRQDLCDRVAKALRYVMLSHSRNRMERHSVVAMRAHLLCEMLEPTGRSLRAFAKEFGVTPALVSKNALRISELLHLRGCWQRAEKDRETFRQRQLEVARGTHVVTEKTIRRKLRDAQRSAVNAGPSGR